MNWRRSLVRAVAKATGMTAQELISAVWGNSVMAPRKGSKELLEAHDTMPWLRAIMGRVSWSIASVPWCLYIQTEKPNPNTGLKPATIRNRTLQHSLVPQQRMNLYKALRQEDTLKEITGHPALDLLDHGNPLFPGVTCFQLTQTHLDLVGETLWVMDTSGTPMHDNKMRGMPTDYWPMPPTWVTFWPTAQQPIYIIASPRGSLTVPMENVIHFRHPAPSDPYFRSSGVGMAMGDELETDEYAAKHLKNWFRNYARPEVIITADGLTRPEVEKLEDQWLKKLTQQNNKPHFLNRKLELHEVSHTFQEMELSQLRKDERDILIHVIGMPPEILGIIENSNRSTIDAADYLYAKYVQVPRLEFLRIMLQIHLIEHYDKRLILDYISPVMEDSEFELKVRQAAPHAWTVDEWREFGGSAPLADKKGQIHIVPFNMTAVTDLSELAEMGPAPGTSEDDDEDDIPPTPPTLPPPQPAPTEVTE